MTEKRFIVEAITKIDCCSDIPIIEKVITDKEELYSYDDLYELAVLLNEQDTTIKRQGKVNEQQEKEYQEQYSKIQKLQKRIELLESLIPKELIEE